MTVRAGNQLGTPGIRTALHVPVASDGEEVKRVRILMVWEKGRHISIRDCGVLQQRRRDDCGDWHQS